MTTTMYIATSLSAVAIPADSLSGDHHSTALLSGGRVSSAADDQAFWVQDNSAGHDDVMGDRLFVTLFQAVSARLSSF